jgi:hypothetical protein
MAHVVKGLEDVEILLTSNKKFVFKHVFYILGLTRNLNLVR